MSDDEPAVVWDETRLASPHTQADKARRVRHMFDCIAPTYEVVNRVASAGRDRYWRCRMVQLAAVRPDDILLDIACGTGDVTRAFAHASPSPRRLIGLDFSFPMLALAARRPLAGAVSTQGESHATSFSDHVAQSRGESYRESPAAEFCQGDALHLPLGDHSVTLITCAFGIRNFQSLDTGLREMHRVLKAGGRAVILEFTVPANRLLRSLYLFYINKVMPSAASWISHDRSGAYRYLPRSVISFARQEEVRSALQTAGFDTVTVYPLTLGVVAIYVAHKPKSTMSAAS